MVGIAQDTKNLSTINSFHVSHEVSGVVLLFWLACLPKGGSSVILFCLFFVCSLAFNRRKKSNGMEDVVVFSSRLWKFPGRVEKRERRKRAAFGFFAFPFFAFRLGWDGVGWVEMGVSPFL